MSTQSVVGVDVAKDSFDTATITSSKAKRFRNDEEGISGFIESLRVFSEPFVVMEATGAYHRTLTRMLAANAISYSVVNPRTIRHFAKADNILAKTDGVDAKVIATYGERMAPRPTTPPTQRAIELKALVARRRNLIETVAAEKKRKHTAEPIVKEGIVEHIVFLQRSIEKLDGQIDQLLSSCSTFTARATLLDTVPGVGPVLISTLIAQLPELGQLQHKQLAALVGVAPYNCDSGQYHGDRKCWGGRVHVRSALYMATVASLRCNPVIGHFYDQLKTKGKPSKVAIVACMHKLLRVLNAMARDNKPWDPDITVNA